MDQSKCIFSRKPKEYHQCKDSSCHNCGWNKDVADKRQAVIDADGLTKCKDGLRRLVLPTTSDLLEV